ncbi:MAG: Methylase involved in ubiquinone/menaquinone biosynthesis [Candidatus Woesebacteria bacterium GW2011_GWB1_38_5b]|uniref:Methylase involved in ubiquinone/menaquinone biosynthesis n=1 Tax=Candidatus Woesebacteria bacterium GW2011_GWB1_38_5b TaxID=1618569 RepID=A0A0G0MQG2_9BACT|nr:MAG: Methylase involved in ubiquinone/menaquinone biosynthesis [Candidatus Woesebacteria bacterium GW2011_GWB1_38_5b]
MSKYSVHHQQQIGYFTKEFSQFASYHPAPWQLSYIKKIRSEIKTPLARTKVLDIAAGSGYASVEFAKKGCQVTATDLTAESINLINRYKKAMRLKNLKVVKSVAEKLPFPDNTFDVVIANAILEHIPAETQAVNEWRRVLKQSGILAITVPLKFRYIWPPLWLPNWIHDRRIGHLRRYDLAYLKSKFPDYKVERVFYTGNVFKIMVMIINLFFKSARLEEIGEKLDAYTNAIPYGANNIMVIFKKIV